MQKTTKDSATIDNLLRRQTTMKKYLLLLTASISLTVALGQTTFQKTYGNAGNQMNFCLTNGFGTIRQVQDGYIIVGSGSDSANQARNIDLIKIDLNGDTIWIKKIGDTTSHEYGNCVLITSEGGYAVIFEGYSHGSFGIGLLKTNANGDTTWVKAYGGLSSGSKGFSGKQTSDNGFIIVGASLNGQWIASLAKTDANGNLIWGKNYSTSSNIFPYDVIQTNDGGYVMAGEILSTPDGVAIKTDSLGNVLWAKNYGNIGIDKFYSVQELSNGDLIFSGYLTMQDENYWLLKTDKNGNILWSKTYGGTNTEYGITSIVTPDGGFAIAGASGSFGNNGSGYLVKTDSSGNLQWSKVYDGWNDDQFNSVDNTSDGGYILSGFTNTFGAGGYDFYIVKTDALGNCNCNTTTPATVVATPTIMINTPSLNTDTNILQSNYGVQVNSGMTVTTICSNAGINENNLNNSISISPNPFSSQTTLQTTERLQNASLTVYNSVGQTVKRVDNLSGQTVLFQRDNLPSGLYFVRLTQDGNTISADKFVIVDE